MLVISISLRLLSVSSLKRSVLFLCACVCVCGGGGVTHKPLSLRFLRASEQCESLLTEIKPHHTSFLPELISVSHRFNFCIFLTRSYFWMFMICNSDPEITNSDMLYSLLFTTIKRELNSLLKTVFTSLLLQIIFYVENQVSFSSQIECLLQTF